MKKLKLLIASCALLLGAGNASAQTDVTSTYITNPGFESCVAETSDKGTGSNIDYADQGWTSTSSGAQSAGAVVAYGGVKVNNVAAPASDNTGNSGNALGISVGWSQTVTYKTANVTLPAGYYVLSVNVYNNNAEGTIFNSKFGFVAGGTSYLSSSPSYPYGSWVKDEVAFYLSEETEGYFQIGGTAQNNTSTTNAKAFFDNLTLIKYDKQTDYTSSVSTTAWLNGEGSSSGTATGNGVSLREYYGSATAGTKLYQNVSGLKNGIYSVVLYATSHNARGEGGATLNGTRDDVAYIYATSSEGTKKSYITASGVTSGFLNTEPIQATITDIEVKDGTLQLGLGLDEANITGWHTIQIKSLTRTAGLDLSGYISAYESALTNAKAKAETTDKISPTVLTALNTVISTYDTGKVDEEDADALETATEALNNAIAAANTSIASYAIIASGVVRTDILDGWTCTNSNTFHINGWSVEGNSDGSGMTTPFIENWRNKSDNAGLGAGTFSYTLAGLEPGEVYYAQALIRSYNERSADAPNGPNFFINDTETDLTSAGKTFTYNNMSGIYATIGAAATVTPEGTLTLGARIANDANYNWVAFKNVSIQSMDDAFDAAVAKVTVLEGTVPTGVYNTAYAVVTANTGVNYPTTAAGFETAISAIEAAAAAASAYVDSYAAWKTVLTSAGSYSAPVSSIATAQTAIVEAADEVSDVTAATTELTAAKNNYDGYVALDAKADILVAVANDNTSANGTLAAAISTAATNIEDCNTAAAIAEVTATLKTAMVTYIGAANPVGDGAKFDCTFMLTNPDVTGLPAWNKADGWYTEQDGGNSQVMTNDGAAGPNGNAFYEYWSESAAANDKFTLYQKVTLPEGTYSMECDAFSSQDTGGDNCAVYFYANDTQGDLVNNYPMATKTISFVNDSEQEVKIGLKALAGNTYRWMGIGYVELYKVPAQVYAVNENAAWDYSQSGAGDVTLNRTIVANYNTVVFPFSMTQAEVEEKFGTGSKVYVLSSFADDNITFAVQDGITANKPCLLKATEAGNSYTLEGRTIVSAANAAPKFGVTGVSMVGNYNASATVDADANNYIVSGDALYLVNSVVTVKNTRAYFNVETVSPARSIRMSFDGVTGIATVENGAVKAVETGDIYDLSGRKVKKPSKGIYLMNGKKFVF